MALPNGTYWAEGAATIGLWARINGGWTKIGTAYAYGSGAYPSGGNKTVYWNISQTASCGGYVDAFKVTVDSLDSGLSCSIDGFSSVTWQTQSSSSTRSATPNGEKINARVSPQ